LLQDWFLPDGQASPISQRSRAIPQPPTCNRILGFSLDQLKHQHPYLKQRGLTNDTIREFGLGLCSHGTLQGWIAIPIHNIAGQVVAYAGRWPGKPRSGQPKYKLPKGFRKSLELFNQHRAAKANNTEPLVVVEGFFGCLKVWQAGHHRVVALLGSMLSPAQEDRIVELAGTAGHVVLLLDGDVAGRKGAADARERLSKRVSVSGAELDEGQQPESLPDEQLLRLIAAQAAEVVR